MEEFFDRVWYVRSVVSSEPRTEQIVNAVLLDMEIKPRLMDRRGNALLVGSSIYQACMFYDLFGQVAPRQMRHRDQLWACAFRRIKNFGGVEIHPRTRKLLVYLKADPSSIASVPGLTRDVTKIGHLGTGNLEVTIGNRKDLERAQPLILASYQAS